MSISSSPPPKIINPVENQKNFSEFHPLNHFDYHSENRDEIIEDYSKIHISYQNIDKIHNRNENLGQIHQSVIESSNNYGTNSIPDVTRVFDCINRVLQLTRYFPPNLSFEKPFSEKDVIAVIPAYNEELTIGMVVMLSLKHVGKVVVVDDGSSDRTSEIAWLSGADVVQLEKNQGKANAVRTGIARAKEIGCSAVVMLDADGQHNPSEIPILIEPIISKKADMVIGSRQLSEECNDIPAYRRLGQVTLDMATNMGSLYKCSDSQSGYRAFNKNALDNFDFPSEGYNIESDMIEHFSRIGLKITEVPITVRYEVPFKHKKNPFSHGMDVLAHIIGIIGYRRPLLTFGIGGMLFSLIGVIVGLIAFNQYYSSGKFAFFPTMCCGVSLILGMLLISSGLILNTLVKLVKVDR